MDKIVIAIDAMGGDHGIDVTIPATVDVMNDYSNLHVILVGDEKLLSNKLSQYPDDICQRVTLQHASQVVTMDDKPSMALRGKKDSSMRVAINMVKENRADACVSAGNTGALMATARFVLKTLSGINRPAICTVLPTIAGHTHMLDLGANVDLSAEHLFEFAVMGSVLSEAIDNIEKPTVGLLNIGEEELKGNEQVQSAASLLLDSSLNYYGFIEGDDIYKGTVNVVVCDGFIGNIALKTSEGVAKMIGFYLKKEFNRNLFSKIAGLIALPVLNAFKKRVDPREYNGASLLGLRGIVIKSHGSADKISYAQAIREAILEVEKNVPELISKKIEKLLVKEKVA